MERASLPALCYRSARKGSRIAIWIATSGIMPAAIRPMKTIATTKRKRIRISTIGLMMKIVTTKRSIWS